MVKLQKLILVQLMSFFFVYFQKVLLCSLKFSLYKKQNKQIQSITDYSENLLHLNNYCFVFRRSTVSGNQIFYKYPTQNHKILIKNGKMLINLQKVRNK